MWSNFAPLLLVLIMPLLARAAGKGLFFRLPSLLFAAPFGAIAGLTSALYLVPLAFVWAYAFFETGHGTAFHMGRKPSTAQSGRKQFLSVLVDPVCELLGFKLGGKAYCWLFMGLKGWLIALPLGVWYPLYFAIAWPLAYEIGFQLRERLGIGKPTETGEYLTGLAAGVFLYFLV